MSLITPPALKISRVFPSSLKSVRGPSNLPEFVRARSGALRLAQFRSGPAIYTATPEEPPLKKDRRIERKVVRLNENAKEPTTGDRSRGE